MQYASVNRHLGDLNMENIAFSGNCLKIIKKNGKDIEPAVNNRQQGANSKLMITIK